MKQNFSTAKLLLIAVFLLVLSGCAFSSSAPEAPAFTRATIITTQPPVSSAATSTASSADYPPSSSAAAATTATSTAATTTMPTEPTPDSSAESLPATFTTTEAIVTIEPTVVPTSAPIMTTVPPETTTAGTSAATTSASTTAVTTVLQTTTAATTVLQTTTAVPPETTAVSMQLEEIGFGVSPITVPTPNTGGEVYGNDQATIDATDKNEGYVLARWTAESGVRLKVLITGPSGVQYTYNLRSDGAYEVFPFSDGNGSYTIGVYRNTSGNKYATVYKTTLNVAMQNAYAAFLHPNQYVHYRTDSQAIRLAVELTAGSGDTLTKVAAIYRYVTENIRYDYDLAANVQSGYLPDIDAVLAKKRGICFDYAAVMTAMLRGLGIPTKLVVGYCNTEYHAWISVHVEGQGWVNSVVYFDGAAWHHMDPTYAANHPEIGDFSARYTYTEKYVY